MRGVFRQEPHRATGGSTNRTIRINDDASLLFPLYENQRQASLSYFRLYVFSLPLVYLSFYAAQVLNVIVAAPQNAG